MQTKYKDNPMVHFIVREHYPNPQEPKPDTLPDALMTVYQQNKNLSDSLKINDMLQDERK